MPFSAATDAVESQVITETPPLCDEGEEFS